MLEEEKIKERIIKGMSLLSDEPTSSDIFFNFEEYAKQISDLLKSDKMIAPFTIAIHGEWGSGKTTLLNLICNNIDWNLSNLKKIQFNAWEYERSDIVTSLLKHIERKIRKDDNTERVENLAKQILSLAADAVLRKSIGMSKEDAEKHFDSHYNTITTVRRTLTQLIGDRKFIIFIDDLDRCLADNILNMLEAIKMFFNIPKIIVVMAIDITKIERAWELRYDAKIAEIEGKEHIEKMFQLKLALPPKSEKNLQEYIKHHAKSLSDANVEFILHNSQFNPRKIKRTLNLLYVILLNLPERGDCIADINRNFKTDFQILISWIALTLNHPDMAKQIQKDPLLLILVSTICSRLGYHSALLSFLNDYDKKADMDRWQETGIDVGNDMLPVKTYKLLKDVAAEPSSFQIMNHFGNECSVEDSEEIDVTSDETDMKKPSDMYSLLNEIIKRAGLVGV